MSSKAEMHRPVLMILFLILMIVAASLAYFGVSRLRNARYDAELLVFSSSLQAAINNILRSTGAGTVSQRSFQVPAFSDSICFVDFSKELDKFVSSRLTKMMGSYSNGSYILIAGREYAVVPLLHLQLSRNPLCIDTSSGLLNIDIITSSNGADISPVSEDSALTECSIVLYNGAESSSVDVVFVGDSFKSDQDFARTVSEYVLFFAKIEPFASHLDSFNFFRVRSDVDLDCVHDNILVCDQYLTKMQAAKCPNDFVFVLHDRSRAANFAEPYRSSAVGSIASINAADDKTILMHEFGHIFAGLGDEYVDESFYSRASVNPMFFPNCDSRVCGKWSNTPKTGCFEGCIFSSHFRSTETSIMRSPYRTSDFGPWNSRIISDKIGLYEVKG